MKQLPYAIALTALAASAITFAAEPIPPSLPNVPTTIPGAPPTPITQPAVPTTAQPPLGTAETVNCPDVATGAMPAQSATAIDKPPTLNTASVLGPKPKLKPDAETASKVAGAIPATKPYASTINPTAGAADPCANVDPLKAMKPNN